MDANDFKRMLVEEISNCDEILAGKHLEKEGSFYPIGRLGSNEKTIDDSIEELRKLCKELKEL